MSSYKIFGTMHSVLCFVLSCTTVFVGDQEVWGCLLNKYFVDTLCEDSEVMVNSYKAFCVLSKKHLSNNVGDTICLPICVNATITLNDKGKGINQYYHDPNIVQHFQIFKFLRHHSYYLSCSGCMTDCYATYCGFDSRRVQKYLYNLLLSGFVCLSGASIFKRLRFLQTIR